MSLLVVFDYLFSDINQAFECLALISIKFMIVINFSDITQSFECLVLNINQVYDCLFQISIKYLNVKEHNQVLSNGQVLDIYIRLAVFQFPGVSVSIHK